MASARLSPPCRVSGAVKALAAIPNPLLNEAISVTVLAGITGSASGDEHRPGGDVRDLVAAAHAANIPLEVLHRVAAMASGGMDTLPHNGAVITLLAITGLSHRQPTAAFSPSR